MCGPTARPRAQVRPSPRRRGRVLVDRARHAPSLSSPRCVPLDNISQETQQTKPARPAHAGCVSEGRHDRCPTAGFQGDAHHGRGSAPQPGSGAPSQAPLPGKASEQPSRKSSHSRPQTGPSEGSACRAGLGGCLGTWVSGGRPPPPIPE